MIVSDCSKKLLTWASLSALTITAALTFPHILNLPNAPSLCFPLEKTVTIWKEGNANVEKIASQANLSKTTFEVTLEDWVKEAFQGEDRISAKEKILQFSQCSSSYGRLVLSNLNLRSLPDIFNDPCFSRMEHLDLSSNLFTTFPELSGLASLRILNCNLNQITGSCNIKDLPKLEEIDLINNRLTSLELSNLPALKKLNLSCNRIGTLSNSIDTLSSLISLDLSCNPTLSGLPMQIMTLSRDCTVDLTECNLSSAVLERIREITTDSNYIGPHISYSVVDRLLAEEKSIEESLKDLYSIVNKTPVSFSNIEETATLRSWLSRLSGISDYQKKGDLQKAFANKILQYLEQANKDCAFRQVFYNVIEDASATCGDRMALSVLDLGIMHKLATIDLKDMKALANFLIKGPWVIEMLKDVARGKIPALPFFDEIEVYLGYPVKLKQELQIPIDIQEMLYFPCSALKDQDLQEAKDFVLQMQKNEEACFAFLASHDKWKDALKCNYPIEFQAIEENKYLALENSANYAAIEQEFHQEIINLTKSSLSNLTAIIFPNEMQGSVN